MNGFMGQILVVNLTSRTYKAISKDELFYRKYLGGSFLATELFEEQLSQRDISGAFAPENPLIFATGIFAGENVCGATRVNIITVSPETTGTYLSQAGGEFGPEIKRAGFDALVITGKAASPIYLKITSKANECICEFIEASHLWGKDRVEANDILRNELGETYSMASIGPAGENLVAWANIMFEADHYAGRGGQGAVMGSKNLKAICIKGDKKPRFKDRKKVMDLNKSGAARFRNLSPDSFMGVLRNLGTFGLLALNQQVGNLPVRNFKFAYLDSDEFTAEISHPNAKEKYVGKLNPCKACYVACKKRYNKDSPYADRTSLAEYESIALLGPNIGLKDDLTDGLRACEMCNRLGLDTMSTGNIIAWMMDCYENNILSEKQFGFTIKFGDGKEACQLIENIVFRATELGNILADGPIKALKELGEQTKPYLRASRGIGLPAHMPRKKPVVGFGYLHGPNPADHMKLEHDWLASDPDMLKGFSLNISSEPNALDKHKVEIGRITQIFYSMIDTLSLCMFVFGPGNIYTFDEITEMVNAATGLDFTFDDLMKIGEESIQLQRRLYERLGGKDETFLPYLAEEIPTGPSKGSKISESDFLEARKHYYSLWKWDRQKT